ncbi:universal stress protein [Aestuariivivens sediminis]|uniref:universal stress protein n=1 Tax=Aestuariivivens sediminis TaxID=2913557 RepID=UPI001F5A1EE9|nr:universal stress protein [Aestuariivivens sediminis]
MKNILIPIDFSQNAINALDYAMYLFEKEKCLFHILHVYFFDHNKRNKNDLKNKISGFDLAERKLLEFVKELQSKNENPLHSFNPLTKQGFLNSVIREILRTTPIEFIFMGTKGANGAKRIFMGSNTVRLINDNDFCNIVVVPQTYDYDIPDKIVFVTNFKYFHKKVQLKPLINMAKLWNSEIGVFHIDDGEPLSDEQKMHKAHLTEWLRGTLFSFWTGKKTSKISNTVLDLTKNKDIGMVAMMNGSHSFIDKLISESVVDKVAYEISIPFLILRN